MKNQDITKTESGLQQYDGVGKTREPSMSYQDGDRLQANDIGDRDEHDDNLMNEAIRATTGNRRDQPQNSEADLPTKQD